MSRLHVNHGYLVATKPCINCEKEIEGELFLLWEQDETHLCAACLHDLYHMVFDINNVTDKKLYSKQPINNEQRWRIWLRDNFTCQYCGTRVNLSIDHIVPERTGGGFEDENLVTSCKSCNSKKASRTPEQAGMKLLHDPRLNF